MLPPEILTMIARHSPEMQIALGMNCPKGFLLAHYGLGAEIAGKRWYGTKRMTVHYPR